MVTLVLYALWTAFAAWLSLGIIAFTSAGGTRIGLLSGSPTAVLLVLAAAAGVVALLRAGAARWPLSLLLLTVLPWLPMPVPAAFLIWSGPLVGLVWIAVAAILVGGSRLSLGTPGLLTGNGTMAAWKAGMLALIIFAVAAWGVAPMVPTGDEPHYLVITQSLLRDRDLNIENNHQRGDYRAFYGGDLAPHVQRRGRNGEIYSVHAPGLPAIVLPAFAAGGYHGVVVFLLLLSAAGSALAWRVAWLATRRTDAAWFAWASVSLPVTAVFHSFAVYPDGAGGVIALTGVWALLRAQRERDSGAGGAWPWFWHGAALATLPWLHTRFALIAGGFGGLILLRLSSTRNPAAKAAAFLSLPTVSAVLWIGFFIALYGTPDPAAPYGTSDLGSLEWVPGGMAGLLFDQRFGLLAYAPVLAFAFAGFAAMAVQPGSRRLAWELLFVMVPYLVTVTHFPMWWAGASAPARFFVPVLGILAVPAAACWIAVSRRRERTLVVAALAFTVLASAILLLVDRGRLAFNERDTPALWLEWLSRGADLPQAFPSWTRGRDLQLFRDIGIWIGALLGAALAVFGPHARNALRSRTALHVALASALAIAVMGASTVVWLVRGTDGYSVIPGQLRVLRALAAGPRTIAVDLMRLQPIDPSAVPRRLRLEMARPLNAGRGPGRADGFLFEVPRVPAGEYQLTPQADAPRGWIMIGIGRDQFALRTAPIPAPPQPVHLTFPVAVRAIVVRGDEDAGQSISGLLIEPRTVARAGDWEPLVARSATRHGHASVFFLDDRSYPEPEAFWVRGGAASSVVVQPDDARPVITMMMRNGPGANQVTMATAGAQTVLEFAPGEERRVAVPVDASRRATLLTVSVTRGFRPADLDPDSRDRRFLGIWVKLD